MSVMPLARSTLQYRAAPRDDEALRLAMIRLAKQCGRYGYRKVAELLPISIRGSTPVFKAASVGRSIRTAIGLPVCLHSSSCLSTVRENNKLGALDVSLRDSDARFLETHDANFPEP